MAQLTDLKVKLQIILEQTNLALLPVRRKQIFIVMTIAILSSLPIIIVPSVISIKAIDAIE